MVQSLRTRSGIAVSPQACVYLAFMLLAFPLPWLFAAVMAAAFHEACHYAAIVLTGGDVRGIRLGSGGIVMEVQPGSWGKEAFCALAGPVGAMLLLLFARWIPRIAVCAVVQSLYNLLPVYPLDGGRVLRCVLFAVFPPAMAQKLCGAAGILCICLIWIVCLYAMLGMHLGVFALLPGLMVTLKTKIAKIPCKPCL